MIEKRHPFGDVERMMKRHADHRRAQTYTMRASRSLRQRHFRRRHGLPTARMVLADEKLVVAKLVGVLDQ